MGGGGGGQEQTWSQGVCESSGIIIRVHLKACSIDNHVWETSGGVLRYCLHAHGDSLQSKCCRCHDYLCLGFALEVLRRASVNDLPTTPRLCKHIETDTNPPFRFVIHDVVLNSICLPCLPFRVTFGAPQQLSLQLIYYKESSPLLLQNQEHRTTHFNIKACGPHNMAILAKLSPKPPTLIPSLQGEDDAPIQTYFAS